MFKDLLKISLIVFLLMSFACQKSGNSSGGLSILGDDTAEAVKLVADANEDLKQVKAIYKDNKDKISELQAAIAKKDIANVKKISDNLVKEIARGVKFGENATKKIEEAQALNINPVYKEYLEKKQQALEKQIGAFEYRGDAAKILSEGFGGTDKAQTDRVIAEFKEKEEKFQRLWKEGLELSQDANDFAKESEKKAKKQ